MDRGGTGLAQCQCAGAGRGTGGVDIVEKEDVLAFDNVAVGGKGCGGELEACGTGFGGLRGFFPQAFKGRGMQAVRRVFNQIAGHGENMVVMTLACAAGVAGYWNNEHR